MHEKESFSLPGKAVEDKTFGKLDLSRRPAALLTEFTMKGFRPHHFGNMRNVGNDLQPSAIAGQGFVLSNIDGAEEWK